MLNGISVLKLLRDWIDSDQSRKQYELEDLVSVDALKEWITHMEQRCLEQYPKKEYIIDRSGRKPVWIEKGVDDWKQFIQENLDPGTYQPGFGSKQYENQGEQK